MESFGVSKFYSSAGSFVEAPGDENVSLDTSTGSFDLNESALNEGVNNVLNDLSESTELCDISVNTNDWSESSELCDLSINTIDLNVSAIKGDE